MRLNTRKRSLFFAHYQLPIISFSFGLNFDIFVAMRKLLFFILLFPLITSAQLDFETYTAKLDFVKLPEIESLLTTSLPFDSSFGKKSLKKLPSFKMSKENYREPVSMLDVMVANETYIKSDIKISLDPTEYGVYGGSSSYNTDGSTKVKNIAYKDASRGFSNTDSCPPNGICARCAPYRLGRRY